MLIIGLLKQNQRMLEIPTKNSVGIIITTKFYIKINETVIEILSEENKMTA